MEGLEAKLQREVSAVAVKVMREHPTGKHNQGRMVLDAFIWDSIVSYAKGKSEDAWKRMETEKVYEAPTKDEASEKMLTAVPNFEVHGKVTTPVKRFNDGELATLLKKSKYKIPEATTKQFVDKAKIGTKGNLYLSIVEKSS